jgi:uncharacterized protein (DUF302 family)
MEGRVPRRADYKETLAMQPLGFEVRLDCTFSQAIERVTAALKQEGFGVLTRIDVHSTLKDKLGVEFRPYAILGACNPALAHRALSTAPEVGLLLPCNVTVEGREGGALVRIIDPREMMKPGGFDADERLAAVGGEAFEKLKRVADGLAERVTS